MLLGRQSEVKAEIAPLKAELKEIDAALAAISGGGTRATPRGARAVSISEQTLAVLSRHPDGLATATIAEALRAEYARLIRNRNMSWHLSKLKREGKIILDGEHWRIPPVQNETPDNRSGASITKDDERGGSSSNESKEAHDLLR